MKFLKLIIFGILLFFILYYKEQILSKTNAFLYQSQCDTPRLYHIGSIDPRFNVTTQEFEKNIDEARNIWNKTENKMLFLEDPKGQLAIDLVYDERQSLKGQINNLDNQLQQQGQNLNPRITQYQQDSANYQKKLDDFNARVQSWNNRGGAPKDEYDKLQKELSVLDAERTALIATAQELNQSTAQYNSNVRTLDQTIDSFNTTLEGKPEEGRYSYDNGKELIEIYFDLSKPELVHTLAHELGHALNLPHNTNPNSIMYPRSSTTLVPTNDDITALTEACRKRSIFEIITTNIPLILSSLRQVFVK